MRRLLSCGMSIAVLCACALGQTQPPQPALGDVARNQRAANKKSATRVFTNDDLEAAKRALPDTVTTADAEAAKPEAGKTAAAPKPASTSGDDESGKASG